MERVAHNDGQVLITGPLSDQDKYGHHYDDHHHGGPEEHSSVGGGAVSEDDLSLLVSGSSVEVLSGALGSDGREELQAVFMIVNLPDAAPQDVPDGHDEDVELYGEGVEPGSHTKDVGYLIIQLVTNAAGCSSLNDTDDVVEYFILSFIAGPKFCSFQVAELYSATRGEKVRLLSCGENAFIAYNFLCEIFLHKGIQSFLYDSVDPE